MDVNKVLHNISERQKKIDAVTNVERNLTIDFGSLTAWDAENVTLPKSGSKREDHLRQLARENTQFILNKLYAMDNTEIVEGEKVLKLPEPTTVLPRAKPPPEPKQPTKWERFAREKGIKSKSSKTRDKLVWDDETRKWVPRYGYKKVQNDREKNWCVEVPDNQ